MDDNGILGVKMNGLSFQINELSIGDDQQNYDYICNIVSTQGWNGNGKYSISILDSQMKQGIVLNGWELREGSISYDWGNSSCYFVLRDSVGTKTKDIYACGQRGSMGGFNPLYMTKAIFPKAIEIMRKYETAEEYEVVTTFEKKLEDKRFLAYESNSDFDYSLELLDEAISSYLKVKEYYSKGTVPDGELKIIDIREEMKDFLSYFKKKD